MLGNRHSEQKGEVLSKKAARDDSLMPLLGLAFWRMKLTHGSILTGAAVRTDPRSPRFRLYSIFQRVSLEALYGVRAKQPSIATVSVSTRSLLSARSATKTLPLSRNRVPTQLNHLSRSLTGPS
jgi:hypothetical protein